jgi:outer membrane protein OmpA-like peptidoglycan-associated protein
MKAIKMKKSAIRYLILFGLIGTMGACASSHKAAPDTGSAQKKIQEAQQAGAQKYAPDQLDSAKQALKNAKASVKNKNYKKASRQTRQASVDAQLATATTRAKKAQEGVNQLQQSVQGLQQDIKNMKAKMGKSGVTLTFSDMLFDFDKSDLKPGAQQTLSKLANFLKEHSNTNVLIKGYTDSRGSKKYNLNLSKQRANSTKKALVNDGVSSSRIQTKGYGEQYPVATNRTVAGRQLNRRVVVVLSKQNNPVEPQHHSGMMEQSGPGQ